VSTADAAVTAAAPADASTSCSRSFDDKSFESARRALSCPSPNSFDGCGGLTGTCESYRVLEEDNGLQGITRYYDEHGALVGKETRSFEWPNQPAIQEGNVPKCRVSALQSTCAPSACRHGFRDGRCR